MTTELLAQTIEKLAAAIEARPPEAPASISFKVQSPAGFELMLTVRNGSMSNMLKDFHKMEGWLLDNGFTPAEHRRPTAPAAPQPAANAAPTVGEFTIESIDYGGKTGSGADLWKVRGGNFVKWGLPLYPETIAAAGLSFDPANPPNATGWLARYQETPDGKKKIIAIEKR